jgi:ABC-type transporter Mla MlaB component
MPKISIANFGHARAIAKACRLNHMSLAIKLRSSLVAANVTLRIEMSSDGKSAVLQLAGELKAEELNELARHIEARVISVALDLAGITVVDFEAVGFLVGCEDGGVSLLHCPAYVREWMNLERVRTKRGGSHSE